MLPKVININRFDVDSKRCPQTLRLVLREQIRSVFKLRHEFQDSTLSNTGIDAFIDKWWLHHQNIIRAASIRPEWDWKTLSLLFDENVSRPVNFFEARKDFLILLARPQYMDQSGFKDWNFSTEDVCSNRPSNDYYLGDFHKILYQLYYKAFCKVVLEDKEVNADSTFTDDDAYLVADIANSIKTFIDDTNGNEVRGAFCTKGIGEILGKTKEEFVPFNKLPKLIFEKIKSLGSDEDGLTSFVRTIKDYFINHADDFLSDLYKSIGAHQVANERGPVKTTLTNKLVKSYYEWLTALTIGFSGNALNLIDVDFDYYLGKMKEFSFYTDNPLKIRNESAVGFTLVNYGTYEQIFARLQENVKGSFTRESFIVSFHPCDMITCSLGYNWSSCQSFVDNFVDFPQGYGNGFNFSGAYNRGNFQFTCGNGFIAYVPYEKLPDVPQFLWAKKKRCLIWVGDNLDCMRQNFFYPCKPSDQETLAFGKVIREYIQNVCAPFNFSNGTMDWKCAKSSSIKYASQVDEADFTKFEEIADPVVGRYDDPIMSLSYLKHVTSVPKLNYALNFPRFDTGLAHTGSSSNKMLSFFANTHNVCPICGKHIKSAGICSSCKKELIEHNGIQVHPSNLVSLNVNGSIKYFDINELSELDNYVTAEDGTAVEFKSAFKVFMPSGIKYFKVLPDYVKQCKVCKGYFHPSFMIGDVCIEHFNNALQNEDDFVANVDDVINSFLAKSLSFDCNDTNNLIALLRLLDNHNIKWVSGVKASEFVPQSLSAKRMFLSLSSNNKLIISSQAKSTVIKLSNLFKKGGE